MVKKSSGVQPLVLSLKVDIDGANKAVKEQMSDLTKTIGAFYSSTGRAMAAAGVGAAVGAIVGLGTAMLVTVGAASKFEDSFAGIKKTVNASDSDFDKLALSVRKLATEIPIATQQLNQIGELGGQLGISTGGLPIFIDTIAKIGVATRLSTETAALSLARLQTIFQLSELSVSNLASSLVDLGNNFAALEDEILSTSLRLAAGAKVAGATAADTLAIATALQAVGVQSQAGGTAMARVFQAITLATQGGNKELNTFASVTGMTAESFKQLATDDPARALNVFLIALKDAGDSGRNVIEILEELGLKQQRTIRALLAVSEAGDLLAETLNTANLAYDLNVALQDEANKRFETAKSQIKLMKNSFTELRIEMGQFFLPALKNIVAGMTGLSESLQDSEKGTGGMSKGVVLLVGFFSALFGTIALSIGALINLKMAAIAANSTMMKYAQGLSYATLITKGHTKATAALTVAMKGLLVNMGPILIALAALTAAFLVNQGANVKARRATEAYGKGLASLVPMQEKARKLEERLNVLREEAANADFGTRMSSEYMLVLKEQQAVLEAMEKIENATNRAFLNIPKFKVDLGLDESVELIDLFNKGMNESIELTELLTEIDPFTRFSDKPFMRTRNANPAEGFAELFDIDVETAQEILQSDFDTLTQFLVGQLGDNEKAIQDAGEILQSVTDEYFGTLSRVNIGLFRPSEANEAALRSLEPTMRGMEEITTRLSAIDSESEMIIEDRKNMLAEYNAMAEDTEGLEPISETAFNTVPEAALLVFKAINGLLDIQENKIENIVDKGEDIKQAFIDALDPLQDINQLLSEVESPEIIDIDELIKGSQKVKDLNTLLSTGVFQVLEAGFPALAMSFADGGLEAQNLGKIVTILNAGIENNTGLLQEMNDSLIDSNEDYNSLLGDGQITMAEISNELHLQYGIQRNKTTEEERSAAINRVTADMQKTIKYEGANYLDILKDILNDERAVADAKEEIADLTQEISDMQEDLVYDNITITNAAKDQLTIAEAKAAVEEAISDFGRKGVVTKKENISLLQMELNVAKMQDQIDNKMDKRRQKSLRDKKKEIKFLELALEQGVIEQLDLDAAKEDLAEMQTPISGKQLDLLKLQKEIAEAEFTAAKERAKGLSPEIISAIENYNSELNVTQDRADEVARMQEDLARETADLNITLAENAVKYDDIAEKFPDFKDKVSEIASMIGIPDEMLSTALGSMEESVTAFIDYVDYAQQYKDKVVTGSSAGFDTETGKGKVPIIDDKYEQDRADDKFARDLAAADELHKYEPDPKYVPKTPSEPFYKRWQQEGIDISGGLGAGVGVPTTGFQGFQGFGNKVGEFFSKFSLPKFEVKPFSMPESPVDYNDYKGITGGYEFDRFKNMFNNAYGGNVPIGRSSVVGEMGPEVIMSTPGGTSVFSNKTGGSYGGVTVENMNVNITGLPADPISARKAAINIRKELTKLENEGSAGTGLRNR